VTQEFAQLVLFSTDPEQVSSLKKRFSLSGNIHVACGTGPEIGKQFHLDALWMTPMQASYFGVAQVLPFGQAAIFPMPADKVAKGLPRLMIVGVALTPERHYPRSYEVRIPAEALASAIADYNGKHDQRILRVGSVPENLSIESADSAEAIQAVQQAFSGLRIQSEIVPAQQVRQRA
jgi:hypothetical protein